jgi:hypothetical protein
MTRIKTQGDKNEPSLDGKAHPEVEMILHHASYLDLKSSNSFADVAH